MQPFVTPDQIYKTLLAERAKYQLSHTLLTSYGKPISIDTQSCQITVPFPDEPGGETFPVTSAAIAFLTLSPHGQPSILLVGEHNRWDLPSGGKDPSDSTAADIAYREFLEEVGWPVECELFPLDYVLNREKGTAGIQYLAISATHQLGDNYTQDQYGHFFFPPPAWTDADTQLLALEPLQIFTYPELGSLTSHSHHPRTLISIRAALGLRGNLKFAAEG